MTDTKSVVVTGAAGYIGSGVCRALLKAGFRVVGMDSLMQGSAALLPLLASPGFSFLEIDINRHADLRKELHRLRPFAIVHLAAIVGDPACRKMPGIARKTNVRATQSLFATAVEFHVARFVFASTCSNYGLSGSDKLLGEDSPLNPLSLYAETKVATEQWLIENSDTVETHILRFGTAHGLSCRMRFDLTVNEFARAIVTGSEFDVYDAETWRPYCHVNDFAELMTHICSLEQGGAGANVFNVGSNEENYRKIDLIEAIARSTGKTPNYKNIGNGTDRRNYRVNFAKIAEQLGFQPRYDVSHSARQIRHALKLGFFRDDGMRYANA